MRTGYTLVVYCTASISMDALHSSMIHDLKLQTCLRKILQLP